MRMGNGGMQRMIVIEREYMAKIIRALKAAMNSEDYGYRTGYIVALSTVEGVMAVAPEYDLDKVKDLPHPGLYTPEEVAAAMTLHARGDSRFKACEMILYSPSEVRGILEDRARKWL